MKMKGIYKGFKYTLSQIFVVKEEREMEIGYPTDVKHLAHIGWDGLSSAAPSWMNEFNSGPNFAATSIGNMGAAASPWSARDLQSVLQQSSTDNSTAIIPEEVVSTQKKQKQKKPKSTSSPEARSSSSRSSRMGKSKPKFTEGNAKLANIEVA